MLKKCLRFTIFALFLLSSSFVFSACSNKLDQDKNDLNSSESQSEGNTDSLIVPDIMSDKEKGFLGINLEDKIQVLARDEYGYVISYILINSDEDIVSDKNELEERLRKIERASALDNLNSSDSLDSSDSLEASDTSPLLEIVN